MFRNSPWVRLQPDEASRKSEALPTTPAPWVRLQPDTASRRARASSLATVMIATLIPIAPALAQQPKEFSAGDAKAGAAMVAKDCNACHIRRHGSEEKIYLRADRRVNTPAQLKSQVAVCNSQLGTNYFPDEEDHIAAYLNLQYYKFKP